MRRSGLTLLEVVAALALTSALSAVLVPLLRDALQVRAPLAAPSPAEDRGSSPVAKADFGGSPLTGSLRFDGGRVHLQWDLERWQASRARSDAEDHE